MISDSKSDQPKPSTSALPKLRLDREKVRVLRVRTSLQAGDDNTCPHTSACVANTQRY